MEFCKQNFFDTTTQIVVNSNTITAENLLSPQLTRQYVSESFNNDSTTTTIRIQFDQTMTVDRIAILGHNIKSMTVFYNGTTASTFSLTGSGSNHTTTSNWTTNSLTSMFLRCAPVACTSVSFDLKSTIVANSEKAVGQIIISQQELDFDRIPSANDYTPILKAKELSHELSDGGLRTHLVAIKKSVQVKFKHLTEDFRDDLKAIYDQHSPKIFVPFPTATAWDGIIFEANWFGDFDFYKYSDNAASAGFSGNIKLRET